MMKRLIVLVLIASLVAVGLVLPGAEMVSAAPAAPTLISPANGAAVTGTSVTFEWSAVTGAVKYKLLVSRSTGILDTTKYKCNVDLVDTGSGLPTTYVDTGYPVNGTKYYWWVWAYAADGSSSVWAQVSANGRNFTNVGGTTFIAAPTLVSPANGAIVIGTSVPFEWSAVTGAVKYKLLVSRSTGILDTTKYKCNVDLVDTGSGLPTTYIDTGYPANGTKYYWWVWAYAADGSRSVWSQVSANGRNFTNTGSYIAAPSLVSPANGASISRTSVTFEWSPVTGAVRYQLLVSRSTAILDSAKYKRQVYLDGEATTTYVDTGYPANGTKFYWWVWAYAADGSASLWSEVSANRRDFTNMPTSLIAAPTLVSPDNGATITGTPSVMFEWSAVTGAVKYKLLVSTGTGILDTSKYKCNVDLVDSGSGLPTTYTDTSYPMNGTKYYWWVWAYAADGSYSLWSEVSANGRNFTIMPTSYVAAPTLVSPPNGAIVIGTSVTFEWYPVVGAVNYRLIVSTSSDILNQTAMKTVVDVGTATTYLDTDYASGCIYFWWVSAYSDDGSQSLWWEVSDNGRWFGKG